jgi:hypothetical protein
MGQLLFFEQVNRAGNLILLVGGLLGYSAYAAQ